MSVQAKLISRFVSLSMPTHQRACNSQHYQLSFNSSEPKQSSLSPPTLQGASSVFYGPFTAKPTNHGPFTAKPTNHGPLTAKPTNHGPLTPSLAAMALSQPSLTATMCTAPCG